MSFYLQKLLDLMSRHELIRFSGIKRTLPCHLDFYQYFAKYQQVFNEKMHYVMTTRARIIH